MRVRRRAAQQCIAALGEGRKGYHTFRCGDYVQCTMEEARTTSVAVFGVMLSIINQQLRRVLVLCEDPARETIEASQFLLAPWNMWSRVTISVTADRGRKTSTKTRTRKRRAGPPSSECARFIFALHSRLAFHTMSHAMCGSFA
eukprot:9627-Pleurochrysis_carterae.AAC.1